MKFLDMLDEHSILVGTACTDKTEAIRALVEHLNNNGFLEDPERALELVLERENEYPTGIGGGVAIPHANTWKTDKPVLAMGVFHDGLDFGSPEGDKATVVVLLLTASGMTSMHLKLLARISRLAKHSLAKRLSNLNQPPEILAAVRNCEQDFLDI